MAKLDRWRLGSAAFVFCIAGAIAAPAQRFTKLANFSGTNGATPYYVSLVQGTDGNLYGTTFATAFNITPRGTLNSVVVNDEPSAGLVLATDGNFYGTTSGDGTGGTVFKITPAGMLTTLYSFGGLDGAGPFAGLFQATDGKFRQTERGR